MSDPLHPVGSDPVFIPERSLFKPDFVGREGEFYNTTPDSSDVNINNSPNGFFPREMGGKRDGFAIVIPTPIGLSRTSSLITALDEGNFLDRRTRRLDVELATINPKLRVLSFSTAMFTQTPEGTVAFSSSPVNAVPAFLPDAANLILLAAFLPLWIALFEIAGFRERTPSALAGLRNAVLAAPSAARRLTIEGCRGKDDDNRAATRQQRPKRHRTTVVETLPDGEDKVCDLDGKDEAPRCPWPVSVNGALRARYLLLSKRRGSEGSPPPATDNKGGDDLVVDASSGDGEKGATPQGDEMRPGSSRTTSAESTECPRWSLLWLRLHPPQASVALFTARRSSSRW
jgi:hypothetical protein